ncbi:DUF1496 domain-containing protein [Zobellella iuensis]|uniref:DUF1496 domain-containing protein n=1 Tax=Zobellella iuensis TaxID=2803811 RepID=A0ABS1QSV2_9GAMM|nr:DUF1496 domain-containing protein [Zobellella iuensis]MBL1377959.1 DUF1496 domain-containing protein [Zobellella iuensis]
MIRLLCWGGLLISAVAGANPISTRPPVELNISSGLEPVCFYADQRYSKGALITVGEQLFICEREKSFEQNGRLSWHPFPLKEEGRP